MATSGIVPATRTIHGVGLATAGVVFAWVPNASVSPTFMILRRIGGPRLWFTALSVFAVAQVAMWWMQQLHWHVGALWCEGSVLAVIAASLGVAAVYLHGQGLGGAVLFASFATSHLWNVPAAWGRRSS